MALWKSGTFIANEWRFVPDDRPLPRGIKCLVTPARWEAERAELLEHSPAVGLLLASDADLAPLRADLNRFPVIAVSFPKFADGRSFSQARLLRERENFTGEIRAVGEFFIDQVPFMRRVGIDAFETDDPVLKKAFADGVWPEVDAYLQPAFAGEVPAGTRPWHRRAGA